MPSKKQYNLVNDDAYDCRIPLYNEEAFQHGITFHAKYIGSLDVPRPTSRVEIVAAMRRIRYEFKAKSVKKKKVSITISVDGVKVVVRNKRKSNQWLWDENKFTVMHHPIYRIFYVSHDSQDLKIFSYIARDGGTNAFKCNVFKSKKKSQAMRIVRTVGQAFEVCHKLSLAIASSHGCNTIQEDIDYGPDHSHKGDGASEPNSDTQAEEAVSSKCEESAVTPVTQENNNIGTKRLINEKTSTGPDECSMTNTAVYNLSHHIQLLRDQIDAQNQQMEAVTSQVQILKDQLAAETTARIQAQAQNEHLLVYNRELLEHITRLVKHFHELEKKYHSGNKNNVKLMPELSPLPQTVSGPTLSCASLTSRGSTEKKNSLSVGKHPESLFSSHDQYLADSQSDGNSTAFDKLSLSSVTFPIASSSPRLESRKNLLTGQSLPGSPSRHNFPADIESHSPLNSSFHLSRNKSSDVDLKLPTHSECVSNYIVNDSSSAYSQGNLSPSHHKGKYKVTECSTDSSSFFKSEPCEKLFPSMNDSVKPSLPHSTEDMKFFSSNHPVENESFIAQVARDLSKLNVTQKKDPQSELRFPSLFNKS